MFRPDVRDVRAQGGFGDPFGREPGYHAIGSTLPRGSRARLRRQRRGPMLAYGSQT
jgi:hypothetical protein